MNGNSILPMKVQGWGNQLRLILRVVFGHPQCHRANKHQSFAIGSNSCKICTILGYFVRLKMEKSKKNITYEALLRQNICLLQADPHRSYVHPDQQRAWALILLLTEFPTSFLRIDK